jgi:D-alanyl-D-alanine carboxypeptidase
LLDKKVWEDICMRISKWILAAIGVLSGYLCQAAPLAASSPLDHLAAEVVSNDPNVPSVLARAYSPRLGIDWQGEARGIYEKGAGPLIDRPFRIASVTKLFVAAATLRLYEQGRLSLNAPISRYLSEGTQRLLVSGGYDPTRITVANLLAHTSGLADHATLPQYEQAVFANGQRRWARAEQIQLAMSYGKKTGEPGERMSYSDTGYLLLAEIIEWRTGSPLAKSVRTLLRFQRLGLKNTWFESVEVQPSKAMPRLIQRLGDADVTGFDPSFDLWGGGGIVSTVHDLVVFMDAFVKGKLFDRPETLAIALAGPSVPQSQAHPVHGLVFFEQELAGHHCFSHAGFWNVDLVACPDLDLTIAVTLNQPATLRRDERTKLVEAIVVAVDRVLADGRRD